MRSRAVAAFSLLCFLFVSACSDETTRPEPSGGPSLAISPTGPLVCDFPALKDAARDYAASNDLLLHRIELLQIVYGSAPPAQLTDLAFDVLSRLAEIRLTSAQKPGSTGAHGNLVARGILACADPALVATLPTTIDFTTALDPAGLFEVRGKDASDPPTLPVYSKGGTETWTALPQVGMTWGQSAARHLLYGHPTTLSTIDEQVSALAFEFSTVPPALTYSPAILRGVCDVFGDTYRVQRHSSLLPFVPITCPTTTSISQLRNPPGMMLALGERLLGLLAPTRAEASMLGAGMAGLGSEFSPHALVDLKEVVIGFTSQPLDGFVNQPLSGSGTSGVVQVQVRSLAGTPLPGVSVTLRDYKNRGTNVRLTNNVAVTDDAGIASFPTLAVNKAGGYTLQADGTYDGIVGTTATSNLFNVKNQ